MTLAEFIQHFINGLSTGSIYALIALGYTLVFGILQLINFAHGDVFMLGAFIGYYTAHAMGLGSESSFLNLLAVLAVAMVGTALTGSIIERFAYRPLRKSARINVLITAVGVSLFLEFAGQMVFGPNPRAFPKVYAPEVEWTFGEININPLQVTVLVISLVLMALLQYIVFKTRLGRAMRAVSFNHDLASLMGIPTHSIVSYTFLLGSALAGAAGVLVALVYPVIDPLMGVTYGLKAFVAAVLGGIGNIVGAVLGSIFLGMTESMVVAVGFSTYKDGIAFVILILVLLFKPTGLLGVNRREKV